MTLTRPLLLLVLIWAAAAAHNRLAHVVDTHSSLKGHHTREHKTHDWLVGLARDTPATDLVRDLQSQLTAGKLSLRKKLDHVDAVIVVIDASDNVDHDELSTILLSESLRQNPVVAWFHRDGGSGRRHHH